MKKTKSIKSIKASFLERFCALALDMLIISVITSLVTFPFINSSEITKLNNQADKIAEKFVDEKIDASEFVLQTASVSYKMSRVNGLITIIELIVMISYFMIYQFYNEGQTVGKKLLKIKVINSDEDSPLTMNNIVVRSLIVNSVLLSMITLAFSIFSKQYIYFYGVMIFEFIQGIVIIVSVILVIYSKSGRGLHDRIARTKVIKTNVVKELETCES